LTFKKEHRSNDLARPNHHTDVCYVHDRGHVLDHSHCDNNDPDKLRDTNYLSQNKLGDHTRHTQRNGGSIVWYVPVGHADKAVGSYTSIDEQ
jgi:hypothetical protein